MIRFGSICLALCLLESVVPAYSDSVVARHTVRSREIIGRDAVALDPRHSAGALSRLEDAIGMEARVVLYAGRPVRPEDLALPALVERNQIVTIVFSRGGLIISAEGRSLSRAGAGERIRVMNLASRTTVAGRVNPDGTIRVDGSETLPTQSELN